MRSSNQITLNLLVAGATGLLGGYLGNTVHPQDEVSVHDELRTRRLLIVDEEGQTRGSFQTEPSYKNVTLWLGWGGPEHPSLTLSVDELEGTPTARIFARSPASTPNQNGILSLRCMSGMPAIAMTQGPEGGRQSVHLGNWKPGEPAVLRLARPGEVAEWPD